MKKVPTRRWTTIFLLAAVVLAGYFLYPQPVQAMGECGYGYVMGENMAGERECISESRACKNQLGLNSHVTAKGNCECNAGYVIEDGECKYGDSVCRDRHGRRSSYDFISNSCECNQGYTLNEDGKCVEKGNNVYFEVLDIDTSNNEVTVKSDYDGQQYLLEYGFGCFNFSFKSYRGDNIVINLGTDYDVDWGDMIVLQNHDKTCDIQNVERTGEDSFEDNEVRAENTEQQTHPFQYQSDVITLGNPKELVVNASSNIRECPSVARCSVKSTLAAGAEVTASQSYKSWFKVTGQNTEGWIYSRLVSGSQENRQQPTSADEMSTTNATSKDQEGASPSLSGFWKRIQSFFLSIF